MPRTVSRRREWARPENADAGSVCTAKGLCASGGAVGCQCGVFIRIRYRYCRALLYRAQLKTKRPPSPTRLTRNEDRGALVLTVAQRGARPGDECGHAVMRA